MENTLDNYEKFVCQYWLQNVLRLKAYPNTPLQINTHTVLKYLHNNQIFLELTPLHLISDEDSIHVSDLLVSISWKLSNEDKIKHGKYRIIESKTWESSPFALYLQDYFRSKGYALTYNGLSVEKMIEYGWVVLKTEI